MASYVVYKHCLNRLKRLSSSSSKDSRSQVQVLDIPRETRGARMRQLLLTQQLLLIWMEQRHCQIGMMMSSSQLAGVGMAGVGAAVMPTLCGLAGRVSSAWRVSRQPLNS